MVRVSEGWTKQINLFIKEALELHRLRGLFQKSAWRQATVIAALSSSRRKCMCAKRKVVF